MNAPTEQRGGVLFLMSSPAYVRNFESVLRALAARGHRATVLFEERKERGDEGGRARIARLCEEHPSLRYEFVPRTPLGIGARSRIALEAGQDYLRYFDPPFEDASRLRARALAFLPPELERGLAAALRAAPRMRRALAAAARGLAGRLGGDQRVRCALERRYPSALILTPMIQFRSRQNDWVLAARELGIGTMLCTGGWDHFTNKGLMHVTPNRVAVWNEAQRSDAIALHGAAPDSIAVTGAWPYDHWLGWRAARSRDELCAQLGLPPRRAMILYVCSSRFIAERERPAVARWARALRRSEDPRLATANVIVRPHHLNNDEWTDVSLGDLPDVAIFPPGGADPVDDSLRADYFDSIANADAVVGVNTSALVESAILDRPALAFPAPEFRSSQEELPHFRQLVEQGIVKVTTSMAKHVAQLSETLANPSAGRAARRRFVEAFIRPRDRDLSPAEHVVAAIEELVDEPDAARSSAPRAWARMQA